MALIVEFILGTLMEAGIKAEETLQARGLGYLVPVILVLIVLLCLGGCCALVTALVLLNSSSLAALSIP